MLKSACPSLLPLPHNPISEHLLWAIMIWWSKDSYLSSFHKQGNCSTIRLSKVIYLGNKPELTDKQSASFSPSQPHMVFSLYLENICPKCQIPKTFQMTLSMSLSAEVELLLQSWACHPISAVTHPPSDWHVCGDILLASQTTREAFKYLRPVEIYKFVPFGLPYEEFNWAMGRHINNIDFFSVKLSFSLVTKLIYILNENPHSNLSSWSNR